MTTYLVSRHSGARDWFAKQGYPVSACVPHLDANSIHAGDVVIGSLPVQLAAEVCEHGARYFHLVLDLPLELRGKELDSEGMDNAGARIEEFHVARVVVNK